MPERTCLHLSAGLRRLRRGVYGRTALLAGGALLMAFVVAGVRGAASESLTLTEGQDKVTGDKGTESMPRPLAPGEAVEEDIKAGESHAYSLTVGRGQYLHLTAEQRGVDVLVSLANADGASLLEVDNTSSSLGEENAFFISEAEGNYRVDVRPAGPVGGGRYRLVFKEARAPLVGDRERADASKAMSEGDRLRKLVTEASLTQALKSYEVALGLWLRSGEIRGQALALYNSGIVYAMLDDNPHALERYLQALPLLRSHGTVEEQAAAILNLGNSNLEAGETYTALNYFGQALPLFEQLGVLRGRAFTLGELGRASYLLGDFQEALGYYDRALLTWREAVEKRQVSNRRGEAFTLDLIGRALFALGEKERALQYYEDARAIQQVIPDQRNLAFTLIDLGRFYLSVGDVPRALTHLEDAKALHEKTGSLFGVAEALAYIAEAQAADGNFAESQKSLAEAQRLQEKINDRRGLGDTLHKKGMVHYTAGDYAKAVEGFKEALSFWRRNQYRPGEANTLYQLSRAEAARESWDKARSDIESAISIIESQRAGVVSASLRVSYFASIEEYYKQHIDVLMQLAKQRRQDALGRLAFEVSERARARVLLDALSAAGAGVQPDVPPALLAREKRLRQQLSSLADLQIRLLSNRLLPEQAARAQARLGALEEEYQKVETEIRMSAPRYAQLTGPRFLSVEEAQADALDDDTVLLEYALGERRSYLWAVDTKFTRSFELPGRAEINALAVPYRELLSKRNLDAGEWAKYEELSKQLGTVLLEPAAPLLRGQRVVIVADGILQFIPFATLQTPEEVDPGGRLPLPTRGAMHRPLITSREIVYQPSLSVLAALRRDYRSRRPAPLAVAIIADPVLHQRAGQFGTSRGRRERLDGEGGAAVAGAAPAPPAAGDARRARDSAAEVGLMPKGAPIPPLIFSGREAREIYRLARPRGALLALRYQANEATATSPQLQRYRILHFSTHALINNERPTLSGLVLSLVDSRGNARDGFLQLFEVYNLKLSADLVVLSACQTALGKEFRGEGLVGLTRGFMHAGTPRVAATLWQVDDEATAALMREFYQNMLGGRPLTPAAALRQAQLSFLARRDRWSAPYYWAGFTVQGEWRPAP